eukprot:4297879-Pleurochrysis_carterae.AAC.1
MCIRDRCEARRGERGSEHAHLLCSSTRHLTKERRDVDRGDWHLALSRDGEDGSSGGGDRG